MSGQMKGLYRVQKKDVARAGVVLLDAFQNDPVWQKIFAGESRREQRLCAFYETPIRYCLKYGRVYAISENLEGIAAWLPGHLANMTLWRMVRSGAIRSGIKIGRVAARMQPVFEPLDQDRQENMQAKPFIYLQIIGVAAQFQGQGLGGRLLRALIEESERSEIPIYLETETEKNVNMYERFGFKLIKQIMLPIIDLPMWEMVREPDHDRVKATLPSTSRHSMRRHNK